MTGPLRTRSIPLDVDDAAERVVDGDQVRRIVHHRVDVLACVRVLVEEGAGAIMTTPATQTACPNLSPARAAVRGPQ
jgi:hypothetical protein